VWNRTAARAAAFASATGARHAATPADAARGADVVLTCFPTSRDVEAVLDGPDGLLAGLRRGSVLVDCTSGDPATSKRIATTLAKHGVDFIDAPVSGGTSGAEKGALTVMVGGDAAVLERVRPVLERFGRKIVHCGPIGAGDALKAVNNAVLAAHIWSLAEGLLALERMGVTPEVALDVINASSGRSNTSENLFPQRVLTRAFPRTFRLALLDKDVGIAAQVARDTAVPAPMLELTSELFRAAHAALGEEADHVEAVKYAEQMAEGGRG
jgi:3-hydroxyisobutyrate dehydrogenase